MSIPTAAEAQALAARGEEMTLRSVARDLVLRPAIGERGAILTVYARLCSRKAATRRAVSSLTSTVRPLLDPEGVICRGSWVPLFGPAEVDAVRAYFDGVWGAE